MTKAEALKKAKVLVSKMTVEEKASQLLYNSPAIQRLGINEYNWWNEGAHGIARAGTATVFPGPIALGATFDEELVYRVADAVSTEARAKYNKSVKLGDRDIYKGITFWTPNINILRDPRWGRGQETFGEDPFLTSLLGVSYIKGLQGEGEFLKTAACAKHFAAHSGPEKLRHGFNAEVSEKDLWETYLPAFEKTVESGVVGVMGAYNRTNGKPCCASDTLMKDILFEKWGFDGYFVSDCGAVADIYKNHGCADSMQEAAALALKCGCDLNCGAAYGSLMDAYEEDLICEDDLSRACEKLFTIRYLLGEFEEDRPYCDIPYTALDCKKHKELNLEAARAGVVLLENKESFLPLDSSRPTTVAVIGPNAINTVALEGNYNGFASEHITVADGMRRVFTESNIRVERAVPIVGNIIRDTGWIADHMKNAAAEASEADVTVLCLGLDRTVEGEELPLTNDFSDGGDRKTLYLPEGQRKLAEIVCENCENVIVVVISGCAVDIGDELRAHAKAVLQVFYPGAVGGLAVAEIIAGKRSPCGRLPVTIYRGDSPLPDISDYSMKGRTYRYMTDEPLYPFGYGLSYARFCYSNAAVLSEDAEALELGFNVKNISDTDGAEKVQIYARFTDSRTDCPNFQLCALSTVPLKAGEEKLEKVKISKYWIRAVLCDGTRTEPDGTVELFVGGHQPDKRSAELSGQSCLKVKIK